MSYTTTASLTANSASASATATSTSGGTSSMNGTLPFAFLITFVGVFLFFLGCGFGSRRLSWELRRNLGRPLPNASRPSEPPALWDAFLAPHAAFKRAGWCDMQPLSVHCVREEPVKADPSSTPASGAASSTAASAPPVQAHRPPWHIRLLRVFDYIPFVSLLIAVHEFRTQGAARPETLASAGISPDLPSPPVRSVQVSVLVMMPSKKHRRWCDPESSGDIPETMSPSEGEDETRRNSTGKERTVNVPEQQVVGDEGDESLGEIALGVCELLWTAGEVDEDVEVT